MVKHLQDHIQFLEQFINNVNALTAKMFKIYKMNMKFH